MCDLLCDVNYFARVTKLLYGHITHMTLALSAPSFIIIAFVSCKFHSKTISRKKFL